MYTLSDGELEIRRIILLRLSSSEHPEILLGSQGGSLTLPQIRIARWQRIAEQLTAAFREAFGIDAISVSSLDGHFTESRLEQLAYEIMEPHGAQDEARCNKHWVAVDSLVKSGFHERTDFHAIRQAVAQSSPREAAPRGPFAHLGWFHELEDWVQSEIGRQGLQLSGRFRQLNASPSFSLIRFETDGPAVWFKAVGVPNEREYPLTLAIARSFSRFVPQIIATRPDCSGWLAREVKGPLLSECSTFVSWEAAASDLAELQICSLDRNLQLLDFGARDLRVLALANLVEPFFQSMGEIMERQHKTSPAALCREELRCLATRVGDALAVVDEMGLATTLGHLDLNPGNIVNSATGSVFLDWAEAFVGHPFLTFEYFREHFRRTFGEGSLQEASLFDRYISPWRAFVPEDNLRRILDVTPLVAVFACAVSNDMWTDRRKLQEPRGAGYLRSLTRRMERETHARAERSLSCPN